ncbi:MAG TPA: Asp23/Gls24 family envelope stress response protein [Herpetosiphonaceae bacterium]|nr:Asp23/Gls24 family envelope stress response protein [Herpetosiphonaceae bacterium]
MPAQPARPLARNARHTTTIDIAVIGFIVQSAGSEIEGIYQAQLDRADLMPGSSDDPEDEQSDEPMTAFDDKAELMLQITLIPFMNEPVPPIVTALRKRVVERIQDITDLRIKAVHIHVASVQMR